MFIGWNIFAEELKNELKLFWNALDRVFFLLSWSLVENRIEERVANDRCVLERWESNFYAFQLEVMKNLVRRWQEYLKKVEKEHPETKDWVVVAERILGKVIDGIYCAEEVLEILDDFDNAWDWEERRQGECLEGLIRDASRLAGVAYSEVNLLHLLY